MTINEYFEYVIKNKLIHKWHWCISVLSVKEGDFSNKYVKIEDGKHYVIVNDVAVPFVKTSDTFIKSSDEVTVRSDDMLCLDKDITTTVGKFIINYILIEYSFGGKIPYQTDTSSLGNILTVVKNALSDDIITVADYRKFVTACTYLETFNRLVTPSVTSKLLVAPPGLTKFKKELTKEFISKYGEEWSKDPSRIVAYDTRLKGYYNEYIKDDPSNNILADKKNKGNSLAKKYLTFSTTNAFGEQVYIEDSLADGYPEDPEKLAAMYNTIRSASYSRGNETQKGGSVAKSVLRATSSVSTGSDDCKVKYGKDTLVTKDNAGNMVGRYHIVGNGILKITTESIVGYIDKYIELRSPMYCKEARPSLCAVCLGDKASAHRNGVPLIVTNISSVLTTSALKAMHNTQIETVKMSLTDILY